MNHQRQKPGDVWSWKSQPRGSNETLTAPMRGKQETCPKCFNTMGFTMLEQWKGTFESLSRIGRMVQTTGTTLFVP